MNEAKTKGGLPVVFDEPHDTLKGASGYVVIGDHRIREYWNNLGHATQYPHHDLSWAPRRETAITYDSLVGYNYVRFAQNHRSAILFADGFGITIVRASTIVRLEYSALGSYQKSKDGIEWTPCCQQE